MQFCVKWCVSFSVVFSEFIDVTALINHLFLNILLNAENFYHPPIPSVPPLLYRHNFVFSLFSLNPSSVLPICARVCGHPPDMVDLTGNWLSLAQSIPNSSSAAWVMSTSLPQFCILSALSLHGSCACSRSCCENICAAVLLCLDDAALL